MDASILTTLVGTVVTLIGMLVVAARLKADNKKFKDGLKREIQGARDAARQMDDRIRLLIDIIITHKGPAPDDLPSRPRIATGPPPEEDL